MDPNQYLEAVLRDQTHTADSAEMQEIQRHRKDVETLLLENFSSSSPRIRRAGSLAKGTMVKESYDLDIACFFPRNEDGAGETLKEIYHNVGKALATKYSTVPKTSAIRLRAPGSDADFHIDVVPGRFVDGGEGDVYIHQAAAEKERLKTNLDVHIAHIRDSGVTDAIRLIKLWNVRNALGMKTFVLELLVIDLLAKKKGSKLPDQLTHVWTKVRDEASSLTVEDPANPTGNDLGAYLDGIRDQLAAAARATMKLVDSAAWESIFGKVDVDEEKDLRGLNVIARSVPARTQPWCSGY